MKRPGSWTSMAEERALLAATVRASDPPVDEAAGRLLSTGTPTEVLARIVPEDPLGLRPRLGAHLARHALLVDVERLLLRAQALCALHAPTWRGIPPLEDWLEERVLEAVEGFRSEDALPWEPLVGEAFPPASGALALDPQALEQACARFNRLPFECREAFFALVLEGQLADRCARSRGLSLTELARRARLVLELFRAAVQVGRARSEEPRRRDAERT